MILYIFSQVPDTARAAARNRDPEAKFDELWKVRDFFNAKGKFRTAIVK